jgi:hypothetical protein
MASPSEQTCKNCGTTTEGNFCPACGQRTSVHKVTFKETFGDLARALSPVNGPLLITARNLIIRPGVILRNYLDGKRRTYYRPVSFFILTTVVYLIIRSVIGYDPFRDTSVVVQGGEVDETLLTEARSFMLTNINNLLFIFVFTLALFLKLFFYRRYSLAEFLAVSFYLLGIYTLLVTFTMFLVQYIGNSMQPLGIGLMWLYFLYAMASFFQRPLAWVLMKSLILFILAFMSYAVGAFVLSYMIVFLKHS